MGLEIKETGRGTDWFGVCEVCRKRCDNHYIANLDNKMATFGHSECLTSIDKERKTHRLAREHS
jgi:hypothetical protein